MRKIVLFVVVCLLCMLVNTHADVIVLDSGMKSVIGGHASNALAFWQCAADSLQLGPAVWDKYVQTWFKTIMDNQNPDGSFHPIKHPKEDIKAEHNMGPAYCTGLYSFVLLVDRGGLNYTSGCSRRKNRCLLL